MIIRKPNEGVIELKDWPHPSGGLPLLRILIETTHRNDASVTVNAKDAARLAGILDAWAEKGFLPDGEEAWG